MEFTQSLQQRHRGIPVLDARGGDQHRQPQAQAVHDLPFAGRHLLPAVPADTVGVRLQAYTAGQIIVLTILTLQFWQERSHTRRIRRPICPEGPQRVAVGSLGRARADHIGARRKISR
ncbi:hypothetical protein [Streptomyces sp. NBC_00191]|uniref:hypothetical protein n=1 Tax=Streptomyces sp. NBC_00191 TaxID=2975674 RepID=UPI00386BBC4D